MPSSCRIHQWYLAAHNGVGPRAGCGCGPARPLLTRLLQMLTTQTAGGPEGAFLRRWKPGGLGLFEEADPTLHPPQPRGAREVSETWVGLGGMREPLMRLCAQTWRFCGST